MWEAWRTYISFGLVGALFVLCQALGGGGGGGSRPEVVSGDPGDRTYRGDIRVEASATTPVRSWGEVTGTVNEDPADAE